MNMPAVGRMRVCWILGLGVAALMPWVAGCSTQPQAAAPPPEPAAIIDVTPRPIAVIPAGTVIGDRAPEGWTHLLVKSYPKAREGDLDKMSTSMRELSELLLSSMLARVEVEPGARPRHRLVEVATGVGTKIKGQDVIISKDTANQLGANLGFLGPWALDKAYGRVEAAKIVLRSETLAVYDAPMLMLRDGKHAPVMLRYVFLLDPATGRLESLQWFIDMEPDGTFRDAHGPMELLRPNHIEERRIHVDAKQFQFGGFLTEQSWP